MSKHWDEMVRESKSTCSVVVEMEGTVQVMWFDTSLAEQETEAQGVNPGQTFSH